MKRSPLTRKTPLRKRNPERRARAYARKLGMQVVDTDLVAGLRGAS